MGQIVHLSVPTIAYPATTDALDPAESVFLLAVRWWVVDYRQGEDPLPRLCEAMGIAGAHDAAFSVDRLMAVVARSVRRPISIHCPQCPHLSDDEKHLLQAASVTQAGRSDLAERMLRSALLSSPGAEFALGPLEGLGELFSEAELIFSRRPEAWVPAIADRTVH